MGRTNPTYRDTVEGLRSRWRGFRRVLVREDKPHFDSLFDHMHAHADAGAYLNDPDPVNAVMLSVLLEHQKEISRLRGRIKSLEGIEDG